MEHTGKDTGSGIASDTMKKNDIYLATGILSFAALFWLAQRLAAPGGQVTVMQDGQALEAYSLAEERELVFTDGNGGRNILVIQNGEAYMKEADCPDKLCVAQKAISKKGESIICLPHRLAVEVTAGETAQTDAVAR